MRAYRFSVKALYDAVPLGESDDLKSDDDEKHAELTGRFKSFVSSWHLGPQGTEEWNDAVGTEFSLFCIEKDESNKFMSLTLAKKEQQTTLCQLNGSAVRGIWSSLNLELLYFANDGKS